jgi:hypothetical protein
MNALERIGHNIDKQLTKLFQGSFDEDDARRENFRYSHQIKKHRTFRAEMEMDNWRRATLIAESPHRHDRSLLYSLYKQALKDPHLLSQIRLLKANIITQGASMINRQTGDENEELLELFQRPWFDQYTRLWVEAEFWGHSLIEFQEMVESNLSFVEQEFGKVKLIDREHVKPEIGQIVMYPEDMKGIPYREDPFNTWLMEIGEPDYLGLLEVAAREIIWKYYSRTDWSRHSEKFADPFIWLQTEKDQQKEVDNMADMLSNFGKNGWGIGGPDDKLNFVETSRQDAYKIYLEMIKYIDQQNSKLVNGSVTGEDSKEGSRAKEESHERVTNKMARAMLRGFEHHINFELIPFLQSHGYPDELSNHKYMYHALMEDADDDERDPATEPPARGQQQLKKK